MVLPTTPADLPALAAVVAATGLFPPELLAPMFAESHTPSAHSPDRPLWLTDHHATEGPIALAYATPERLTEGTWNLLLIAVHPHHQRTGRGAALLAHLEHTLASRAARLLLIDTSSLPAYTPTHAFYRHAGYTLQATLPDFYQPGEDRLTFTKRLPPT